MQKCETVQQQDEITSFRLGSMENSKDAISDGAPFIEEFAKTVPVQVQESPKKLPK
jgi:hypothetical protein